MPFLLISTVVRLETGPTLCGDEYSDIEIMKQLDATLELDSGKAFQVYKSPLPPRVVLNRLSMMGYRLVGSCGVGQSCIWTLFKEDP